MGVLENSTLVWLQWKFKLRLEMIFFYVLLAAIVLTLLGLFFWIFTRCQRNANKYIDDGYLYDGYYALTTNLYKSKKPSETIKLEPLNKPKEAKVVPIVEV